MSAMPVGDRDSLQQKNTSSCGAGAVSGAARLVALAGGAAAPTRPCTPAERRARALARLGGREDFTRRCIEQRVIEGSCHGERDVLAATEAETLYLNVDVNEVDGSALVSCAAQEGPGVLCIAQQAVASGRVPLAMLELACARRRVLVRFSDEAAARAAGLDADTIAGWFATSLERDARVERSAVEPLALERRLGLARDGHVAAPRARLLERAGDPFADDDTRREAQRAALEAARLDLLAMIVG